MGKRKERKERDEGKGRGRERRGRKGSGSLIEARAIYWGRGGRHSPAQR